MRLRLKTSGHQLFQRIRAAFQFIHLVAFRAFEMMVVVLGHLIAQRVAGDGNAAYFFRFAQAAYFPVHRRQG